MKKITLSLVLLLTLVLSGYGQVSYEYGFEPATPPLGGWTAVGFSRQTITPCVGSASVRANTFSAPNSITSPSLGTSNGGVVTFSFDYKLLNWSANTVPTPANQVSIVAEWSNSATGPWFPVGTIDESNHEVSTTCATKTFQFSPTPGALFVKITSIAVNGVDAYVYFDTIVLNQGAPPTCVSPSGLAASAIEANSATLGWTAPTPAPSTGYEFYYSDVNVAPTAAGTPSTGVSANISGLTPNTNYYFWVRSLCGTDTSVWSGPVVFRTLCVPFDDFTENFTSTTAATGVVPNCWTKTVVSTNTGANVSVVSHTAASVPNAILLANSGDATAQVILASPALTAIGANTHRMKFKARGGTAGQLLIVGTMSDATNAATFTPLQTITLGTTYTTYNVSLNTSTTDGHVAFRHGLGGTFRSVFLDDLEWEPIPTAAPGCIEDMNAVTNEGCGNFATTFTWAAVPGADGYTVSIGTAPNGGGLVVDNVNIFSVLNYSFAGNPGTTYYYTVRPYNAFGPAVNCFEDSFTTFDDGCYCVSVPTSNDGAGVTNVQMNTTNFPVTDVTYANLTENGAVDITQGVNTIMNVTLATGFSYATNVWIDFNNNYTFEPSELVFTGPEGPNTIPTIVNTSFITPLSAPLGEHRMRIVTTDAFQNPANPCYNGSWGVAIDILVNVIPAPACLPPASSSVSNITANGATLNWVSEGDLFNVEVMFAGEPQGSGTITSGITGLTTTLSGLDAQANYAYYIQRNCGNGSLSPWTGPFTFRTACNAFGSFTENFTTDVNITVPECWKSLINSSVGTPAVSVSSFNDFVLLNNSSNAAAALYLITPALTDLPLNTHRIKFRARGPVGTNLVVGTMSDPANESTFTAVQTVPMTVAFADFSVSFLNSTTNMYVAFKFVGTATFQSVSIDDVIWEVAPSCPDIYVVNFGGSTTSTADISWTPGGAETAWQYAYGLATLENPDGLVPVDVTSSPAATILGLAPSSTYKVWVRAACGNEFGIWSPARTFVTACAPIATLPWTEGFEGVETVGNTTFPPCWSKQNGDWSTAIVSTWNTPRTGTKYLRNAWSATNEFMWTPGFALTAGVSYDFSFYMQGDGFTGWSVDIFHNSVQNSEGATQLGTTLTAAGSGTISMQPYALVNNTFVPTTSGTYFFAIRVNQPSVIPWYIAFDDFRMEPTPTCVAPLAPTATNVTTTSATMNWTATVPAPSDGYDYYATTDLVITPNATTLPTGTVAAGITTAELTDLIVATAYRIFVRSRCSGTDVSSWSVAGTFSTLCVNSVLPYSINFNETTGMPTCTGAENAGIGNNWTIGSNAAVGFPTNALLYAYHSTNAANAWFYTNVVTLTAGQEYSISYDYGNDSTFWTEKLKVAYGTSATVSAMTTQLADHPLINQSSLQSNTVLFTPLVSGDYYFGFNAYSDANQNNLYVDNIIVQENLSNTSFDNNSFTAYPNPVKDVLNLSFTENISQVAVYNLLGQKVLVMDINATKGQVDMANLATGTYLVKVNTENAVKTIKVIKQ